MKKIIELLLLFLLITNIAYAQTLVNSKDSVYKFTLVKQIATTDVKDQYKSGTCWCFSSLSFFETELLRMGKPPIDLSEMFIVRNMYYLKAQKYLRMTGKINFGAGGEFHDVAAGVKKFGLVPQSVYPGMPSGYTKPEFGEVDAVLKSMLDAALQLNDKKITPNFLKAFNAVLDSYFGSVPEKFQYENKSYTPLSFAKEIGINADEYVEITSFTHHPFYEQFVLEIPDNWMNSFVYNVPLDELQKITDNAIANNYSVAWASDVSEYGFSFKNGLAMVPVGIDTMKKEERDSVFNKTCNEEIITQEKRQLAFDNLSTQDDHAMHIIGMAKDQNNKPFYMVKNSWGTDGNDCKGYFYASLPYFLFKTTFIVVNKNAIPKDLANKLKINQ